MNFTHIHNTSIASSFKRYDSKTFSSSIASQTIPVNGYVTSIATTSLNNSNSISQVLTNYSGLESFYRVLNGSPTVNLTTYQIYSFYYFTSTTLTVYTLLSNQSGGSINIPAITINCRAFLFLAPF